MNVAGFVAVCASVSLLMLASGRVHAQTASELYAEGVKARQEQRFDDAANLLERALALEPDNADALVQLGFSELGGGGPAAARTAFSHALALSPDYADAKFGLALIEYRAGNQDAALAIAEPLARAQPDNAEIAALLKSIRDTQLAANARVTAPASTKATPAQPSRLVARPDPVAPLLAEGRRLRVAGRFVEAETVYRDALAIAPTNTDVLVALGLVSGFQQKFDEAGEFFEAALALDPGNVDARLGMVRLAIWRGDTAGARTLIDRTLPIASTNPEALVLDARISLLERDYARAEQSFAELVAADPRNAEALVGLGDVRRTRGEEDAARSDYQRALQISPDSREIEARLAAPPVRKWRFDLGSEVSDLSAGRGSWTDSAVGLSYRLTPDTTIGGRTRVATRAGRTDVQIEGRIDHAFSAAFSGYALAAATPDADFLARFSIGGGGSWRAIERKDSLGPVFLNIDARYDVFADTRIATISPWFQVYLLDERVAVSARWVHAEDDSDTIADGYVVRGDLTVTERLRLFAGYSDAPEISEGTLEETRTLFGGLSFDVSDRLTLGGAYAHEQRPAFDRDTFGVSLTARF